MMFSFDPDVRRQGVTWLAASKFGGEDVYVRSYRMLIDDPDATVRAASAKALGAHGKVEDALLLVRRLKDPMPYVRWESAQGLQRIHNEAAIAPLMDIVAKDEDADARMAAAYALGQYAEVAVFDVLVGALDDQEYGVVHASNVSLKTLTGYDFGNDGALWILWKKEHPGALFAHREQYVWRPFVEPRAWYDKAQFWKTPPKVEPQQPVGMAEEKAG